jgi:lactoylglutathione lyase
VIPASIAPTAGAREHAGMKINHLHLMVPDVPAACAFFETCFDLRKTGGNAGLTVLLDDDGFVLTLMKRGSHGTHPYPDHFHVGFFVADEARVDALHARMRGDGLDVAAPERSHAYSFYVKAPGGFLVEVGA